jgi:hypothetical protein
MFHIAHPKDIKDGKMTKSPILTFRGLMKNIPRQGCLASGRFCSALRDFFQQHLGLRAP